MQLCEVVCVLTTFSGFSTEKWLLRFGLLHEFGGLDFYGGKQYCRLIWQGD